MEIKYSHCDCHPETCCHFRYYLFDDDGSKGIGSDDLEYLEGPINRTQKQEVGEQKMIEQYVIKTRNDEDEYLAYNAHKDTFYLTDKLTQAAKYYDMKSARNWIDVQVLKDSKYKSDIYKIVQALEFVERGV